jgi:hypothetical protein
MAPVSKAGEGNLHGFKSYFFRQGGLAQLRRALSLHGRCHWFESSIPHHFWKRGRAAYGTALLKQRG